MRHRKKRQKLSRSRSQRKALIKSLLTAIVISERITTTISKAKVIRSWVDRLITWAKKGTLHHKRLSYQLLGNHKLVKKLFENIGPRFKNTSGGYTRIIPFKKRKGDGATLVYLELTKMEKKQKEKKKKDKEKGKKEDIAQKGIASKEEKPKKGFISGVKNIFKREKSFSKT